ncbi:tetratricopeptide repeat protein [Streptomyces coeruleorubidus]|uniref:tetratricopeptide repeat protein n=1 Tax=Streptomyces coeruleorubidus TaxID=116188 RepID=UPI00237F5D32|nr:tetratricopeptide repeat protein [Streptomyces coeruleorubidus]WDV55128.1 tetratricopeptide repeat protein [Streptomyces coeruleorubidus]
MRDQAGAESDTALDVVLLVSRARGLARAGELGGALRLLREAETTELGAHRDVLDLRARVHAQRGETAEAAQCWQRVLARHPEDPAARAGLARLGRTGPLAALGRHRTRTALVAAACVVTAVVAGVVTTPDGPRTARADTDRAAGQSPGASATAGSGRPNPGDGATGASGTEGAGQQEDPAAARRAAALAHDLRAPGLRVTVHGDTVEVAFAEGLFSEGAQLTPAGARQLALLGERLGGRHLAVTVHGHAATVPGAPHSGGSVVALWRALVAARELSAASGEPLTAYTTDSADQRDAPYPDPARNRTVTLVISPE